MIRNRKMRVEEYVLTATEILKSFKRDREEIQESFSDFTEDFMNDFEKQIVKIKSVEASLKMNENYKNSTEALYVAVDLLHRNLNLLCFQFKRSGLNYDILLKVKYDLAKRNVKAACQKMEELIEYVSEQHSLLETKGMPVNFPKTLKIEKEDLEEKIEILSSSANSIGQLYADNIEDYHSLYEFINVISEAGRILYEGKEKEYDYTVSMIIGKMRNEKVEGLLSLSA